MVFEAGMMYLYLVFCPRFTLTSSEKSLFSTSQWSAGLMTHTSFRATKRERQKLEVRVCLKIYPCSEQVNSENTIFPFTIIADNKNV